MNDRQHDDLPAAEPQDVGMSPDLIPNVRRTLQRLVADEEIPGAIVMVARRGKVIMLQSEGWLDLEQRVPIEPDSILRFYSMTKPVTSVAVMMLVEQGAIGLDEPVGMYCPQLSQPRVFGSPTEPETDSRPATREMTIRDLLRHTAGFTYGTLANTPVDKMYRSAGVLDPSDSLDDTVAKLGQLPLLYEPGTRWVYSVATDVAGFIVQQVSGLRLDQFFHERIFAPLGMKDTGFHVPRDQTHRFANNYGRKLNGDGLRVIDAAANSRFLQLPRLLAGGSGLVSTAADYMRFCQFLLNRGIWQERRLLKSDTVDMMTQNQLPRDLIPISLVQEDRHGTGFGLGFSIRVEATNWDRSAAIGEYGWGGAACTHFWISPRHELAVIALTQFMPFRMDLEFAVKPLIYHAIHS